ncbi:MAG: peptidoglycan-associated lipoprotein [candidate division Zixibacteria bacterium RBG_16_48_11]|nr:MAG: peptidoglycan-associated lipoprotein [candidate division Zixibacteria bacterium RBG_16_48_11]
MSKLKYLTVVLIGLALLAGGCKKGTKLEPAVEKPPQKTEEPVQKEQPPQPVQEPQVSKREIIFQKIHFDFDKYNLRPDAITALNENAKVLMENPTVKMRIEGHCDERGTVEYNLALGEKRAQAAKEYLVKLGVSAGRVETISYGKEKPVAFGTNEDAWAKNRRDEFAVISQ